MAKLDRKKLKKVVALIGGGATTGEREAARRQAQAMADKAGVSLDEALEFASRPEPIVVKAVGQPVNIFASLFNSPEWQAEERAREEKRAALRAELLVRFGSEEAVMAPTVREDSLVAACAPLVIWRNWIDADGTVTRYISSIDGFGIDDGRSDLPESVREAVSSAVPLPVTVAEAFRELREAEEVRTNREQFIHHYDPGIEVRAREIVLEDIMETMPAQNLNDVDARFDWARWLQERSVFSYHEEAFMKRIHEDFRVMTTRLTDLYRRASQRAYEMERLGDRTARECADCAYGGQADA